MKISATKQSDTVTLVLDGRLDTAASAAASSRIDSSVRSLEPFSRLTCDASRLTYISSSGLRILLTLSKRYPCFQLAEVSPEVYSVLEMTGFTKIMRVERALRQMSVDGCQEIGHGGVGVVYRIDEDTIIKVFREGSDIQEVKREITMAKEAFVMGMPTAISFDIVRVGGSYGLVYELLNAETLSAMYRKAPDRVDEFARLYSRLFHQLHDIRVPSTGVIPNALEVEEKAIRHIGRYFDSSSIDLLLRLLSAIPQGDRLLHCDLQTKNVMVQGGEPMLIDMGEVCYGHPMIDLGHAYSTMVKLVGDYEQITGITSEMSSQIWDRAMHYYFEGLSKADYELRMAQIDVVGTMRNFSWLSLSDTFPQHLINLCQELFVERVLKRKDYLLDVSKSLCEWTLD